MDLSEFGISEEGGAADKSDDADVTLKELKDAVQLSLVQQSEYLRRFALSFSDRNRDEAKQQQMDKEALLKQVRILNL